MSLNAEDLSNMNLSNEKPKIVPIAPKGLKLKKYVSYKGLPSRLNRQSLKSQPDKDKTFMNTGGFKEFNLPKRVGLFAIRKLKKVPIC